MSEDLRRVLKAFDARSFCMKHRGHKESMSARSHEYLFRCPICSGSNLRWNPTKQDFAGGFICWGCYRQGNTIALVALFERIDVEDAEEFVRKAYVGGDASLFLSDTAKMPEVASFALTRLPTIRWPAHAVPAVYHPMCRAYLHGRGIDDATIMSWGLHAGVQGRERNYVLFPVVMDGGLVYWQGRASWNPPEYLGREERKAWEKDTFYRKSLNPVNAAEGVPQATASDVLFNFDRARASWHVVICEGPVDAIRVGPHAVALLGKGSDTKIARLRMMRAQRYTVYLDRGHARDNAQAKAQQIASSLSGWAEVFMATAPEGHDAGSLTPEQNAWVLGQAVPYASTGGLKSTLVP